MTASCATSGLVVLARAEWPESDRDLEPPRVAGFVVSSFSPLVVEVARRCLRRYHGEPPVDAAVGERTAVVIVSVTGDVTTGAIVADAVDTGRRMPSMLFFQSVPNAVAGHVASRWGLAGPVVCISPSGDTGDTGAAGAAGAAGAETAAIEYAHQLIGDGDADRALLLLVEQGQPGGGRDRAVALLVEPGPEGSEGRDT